MLGEFSRLVMGRETPFIVGWRLFKDSDLWACGFVGIISGRHFLRTRSPSVGIWGGTPRPPQERAEPSLDSPVLRGIQQSRGMFTLGCT